MGRAATSDWASTKSHTNELPSRGDSPITSRTNNATVKNTSRVASCMKYTSAKSWVTRDCLSNWGTQNGSQSTPWYSLAKIKGQRIRIPGQLSSIGPGHSIYKKLKDRGAQEERTWRILIHRGIDRFEKIDKTRAIKLGRDGKGWIAKLKQPGREETVGVYAR
jgi:hypothetical protein